MGKKGEEETTNNGWWVILSRGAGPLEERCENHYQKIWHDARVLWYCGIHVGDVNKAIKIK